MLQEGVWVGIRLTLTTKWLLCDDAVESLYLGTLTHVDCLAIAGYDGCQTVF